MTDIELNKLRTEYNTYLEGQKKILECMKNEDVQCFAQKYFNLNGESISAITKDTLLRNIFLNFFQNNEQNGNLFVYLNQIERINSDLINGQALVSVDYQKKFLMNELSIYPLYCNLETNKPILVDVENNKILPFSSTQIVLPLYTKEKEVYYLKNNLERITKGFTTDQFDRLQLYYFQQLLEHSYEESTEMIRNLSKQDIKKICLQ